MVNLLNNLAYLHISPAAFLGWFSVTLLSIYAIPLAGKVSRERTAESVESWFFWTWYFGELTGLSYVLLMGHWLLAFNYLINVLALSIIAYYKIADIKREDERYWGVIDEEQARAFSEAISSKGVNYCNGPDGHAWPCDLDKNPKPGDKCLCGKEDWKC